jgi:predicted deacetylase
MIPAPAEYLLRCDDLCPATPLARWRRIESLIKEFSLQPILAVVPDNRDPDLGDSRSDPGFWLRIHALEVSGAVVGLHGYRHICASTGRSLVRLADTSEFAGVPAQTQRSWISEGLRILRGHGLNPRIWVAPRHGFDRNTLAALAAEGIALLSDGCARVPFRRGGATWIPQQLWGPIDKPKGLWTICVHANTATDADISALHAFLSVHADQFTSVDRVLFRSQPTTLTLAEYFYAEAALWRLKASRATRRIRQLTLF